MKAQLENSQEEVTTGAQGVTSGQKGPERAKRAYRAKNAFKHRIADQKQLFTMFDSKSAND
jgi:hypothetical protein